MGDWLLELATHPTGARVLGALRLSAPRPIERAAGPYVAKPLAGRRVLLAPASGGRVLSALHAALEDAGADAVGDSPTEEIDVVVADASELRTPGDHRALYDLFHPIVRRLARNARVLVTAACPEDRGDAVAAATARGIEGFVRTLAKETGRRGAQANLLYVASGAEDRLAGPLRYFCTAHSGFVDGQALRVDATVPAPRVATKTRVLGDRIAVVTGAARGIGSATALRLSEEGAHVVCADLPGSLAVLEATARACGGSVLELDVAGADAPERLAGHMQTRFGGVDIVVHNAGITRDRTLAKMTAQQWDEVSSVNFGAITRLDAALDRVLRNEARVVCLSSQSGIAGNFGQTNYATAKAALIGYVAARAPLLAARGITINAVAPGFIETQMTRAIPFMTREAGRRLSSLRQGGVPRDVAEAICFLVSPGAYGITGRTLRVCGQSWLGA